ncbi:MAG TPA: flagellar hook capping FlgD N-terminal domain-containing protein [Opitutaceae bacterium]|jgi:flagellar basal-body rod modification protein FlgD
MQINTVTSNPAATAQAASQTQSASTAGSSTSTGLSETQFLQLLTEQLENQDPLQPEDDTAFLAQMAQFTSLQETDTLNQQVERLTAAGYIGSTVTVNPGNSSPVTGQVSGIDTSGTDPALIINGVEYPLSELTTVSGAASNSVSASSIPTTPHASATASTTMTPKILTASTPRGRITITAPKS